MRFLELGTRTIGLLGLCLGLTSAAAQKATEEAVEPDSNPEEIVFLQTLQTAQISSMSCLITLVNMTYNPIGTCLGLNTLAPLVIAPPDNGTFAEQLAGYLGDVCSGTECDADDIAETKSQLAESCDGSKDTDLVKVLGAILDNYTNSYRTLACAVYFNGTSDLCFPATLNSSQDANSNTFFNDLITGTDLQQYQSSVFSQAECTGCMYEMYKAAVYMISSIRGNDMTHALGDHLQQACTSEDGVDWANVQDQQIPDALQIQQSTGSGSGGKVSKAMRRFMTHLDGADVNGWMMGLAIGVVGRVLGGML